ncbi:hypothetical protein ACLMJK_008377 [Lecanora helva]
MSPLRKLFKKNGKAQLFSAKNDNDLESGQQSSHTPTRYLPPATRQPRTIWNDERLCRQCSQERIQSVLPPYVQRDPIIAMQCLERPQSQDHVLPRTSDSDSEFSEPQHPMTPDRYQDALSVLEGANQQSSADYENWVEAMSSRNQLNENLSPEKTPGNRTKIYGKGRFDDALTRLDPGSSQTSSSARADVLQHSSSFKLRSPTPPLLYGKNRADTSLSKVDSRLETAVEESAVNDGSRLRNLAAKSNVLTKRAILERGYTESSADTDWETISARPVPYERTDSSQATFYPQVPRYHQTFMLVEDDKSQRGQTQTSTAYPVRPFQAYRHPNPLFTGYTNPFVDSPPVLPAEMAFSGDTSEAFSFEEKTNINRNSKQSSLADNFNELVRVHGSTNEANNNMKISDEREEKMIKGEMKASTEVSRESSTWTTTVSEAYAGVSGPVSPPPLRTGSFAGVTVLGKKGNLTGTPEGSGAREVGSSLAGTSSPPTIPESLPRIPKDRQREPPKLTTAETLSPSASQNWTSRSGGNSTPARRRSSSESNGMILASPLATKTSALPSPNLQVHRKRNTMAGIESSGDSSFFVDVNSENHQHHGSLRERRAHQALTYHEDISTATASIGPGNFADPDAISFVPTSNGVKANVGGAQGSQASVSTGSHAFLHGNVVYTDVPRPVFNHPVYGAHRPWDTPTQHRGRSQLRADPYERPIARVESPHLHRIRHPLTDELLQRQESLSIFWFLCFSVIPPFALMFGHGMLDGIIRYQTNGEIESFTDLSKSTARYWGYTCFITVFVSLLTYAVVVTIL